MKFLSSSKQAVAARLLVILACAALSTGCVTTGASKSEDENVFAAYSIEEILEAGNAAFDAGETERAVFIYMQALEIEQSAETWYRIGVGKFRLGDKTYAWKALKQSVELDPEHALAHEQLGLLNLSVGQPKEAALHLTKATDINPTLWRAWNALGVIADIEKRYSEAVAYYQAGLIGDPDSALLMNNIGYSYYLAGDLEQATRWFERAILTQSDYGPARKNMALLYARQGWYDEAVKTLAKVVSRPEALNDTGYIAMRNGDYDDAIRLLTEAIRLSPSYYKTAQDNLQHVKDALRENGRNMAEEAANPGDISEVIFPEGKDSEYRSVMPRALNVRAGPSSDSKIVNYLRTGDEVQVIMTLPGWAFVNYRPSNPDANLTGWVNIRYLSNIGDTPLATPAASRPVSVPVAANPGNIVESAGGEPAMVIQPDSPAPAAVDEAIAPEKAKTKTAATGNAVDPNSIIKTLDAVCDMDSQQANKTPQQAGSCIGVASADADE